MTTLKNQILDTLQMSSEDYDLMIFLQFWNYCYKYAAKSPKKTQQFVANANINKWYMKELASRERTFLDMVPGLIKTKSDLNYHYKGCVAGIINLFPKALFEMIKEDPQSPEFTKDLITNTPLVYAN
ncbi:hypothetical protein [Flavobacterium sp. N1994]|uniref:hypothetical protein n=1 Tax=Flavobacterium sp. N1994 TaxID=2986827 RepID=UPI0022224265|nr:hypothetical protein [Flavobacterium sp. N1994]